MDTEVYEIPLAKLHAGEITYVEFLKEIDCHKQFKKWCDSHSLIEDEAAAQCFFDHYGFEESTIVKQFIEPAS